MKEHYFAMASAELENPTKKGCSFLMDKWMDEGGSSKASGSVLDSKSMSPGFDPHQQPRYG